MTNQPARYGAIRGHLKNESDAANKIVENRRHKPKAFPRNEINLTRVNPYCIVRYVTLEKQKFDQKSAEEQPAYSLTEASCYLLIPPATLRSWVAGRRYPTDSGPRFFRPII
jgi:hypothetical protein